MNFDDALSKLGFSPIETTVFKTLCKHSPLTGYEIAKLSGASRSNVYAALYSLQDKGFCYVSSEGSKKYQPISKGEFIRLTHFNFKTVIDSIEKNFPEKSVDTMPYITITGFDNILHKIKDSICTCSSHIYILSEVSYVNLFKDELESISSSKKVTILCDETIAMKNVMTYKRRKAPTGFHMIIDTKFVITGEFNSDSNQCLYTHNPSLVRLMRESFITELDMINITNN